MGDCKAEIQKRVHPLTDANTFSEGASKSCSSSVVKEVVFEDFSGENDGEKFLQGILSSYRSASGVETPNQEGGDPDLTVVEDEKPLGWLALKMFVVKLDGKEYGSKLSAERNFCIRYIFPGAEAKISRSEQEKQRRSILAAEGEETQASVASLKSRLGRCENDLVQLNVSFQLLSKDLSSTQSSNMDMLKNKDLLGLSDELVTEYQTKAQRLLQEIDENRNSYKRKKSEIEAEKEAISAQLKVSAEGIEQIKRVKSEKKVISITDKPFMPVIKSIT